MIQNDLLVVISETHLVESENGGRNDLWVRENEDDTGVGHDFFNYIHLLDPLDTGLDHGSSLGVGSELVDELLSVSNLLLLGFSVSGLQLVLLIPHFLKGVVISLVVVQLLVEQVNDLVAAEVQELSVVRNDDHGDVQLHEVVFKPNDCVQVQVIGGLIQEQDLRLTENHLCYRNSHSPPSRELLGLFVEFFLTKS